MTDRGADQSRLGGKFQPRQLLRARIFPIIGQLASFVALCGWVLWRALLLAPGAVIRRWQRSLQLRVAATTLLISGLVVMIISFVLVNQISADLLSTKRKTATQESSIGLTYARQQLAEIDSSQPESLQQTVAAITQSLAKRGGPAGEFDVLFRSASDQAIGQNSGGVEVASIPPRLAQAIRHGDQTHAYAPIHYASGKVQNGLIIGGAVPSARGALELYYIYPLTAEDRSIDLVKRAVYIAAMVLVALVATIAMLVTRQVVRPVRSAAQTAERFAEGRLEERMQVRGHDDLSLLAARFNDMADSLQQQISKLEELSRLQRRFTSDVSHELRTPLSTVRMAADVLHASREDFPPAIARSTELLNTELERFESLLADLLEISRYDAGAAILEPEQIDIRTLVDRARADVSALVTQQGSEIRVQQPDTPLIAEVDPRRVQRILRNLIGNAVEHGEGNPIDISLAADDRAVAVSVRDHGLGLKPGEAPLVFNRFWRADPSRNRRTGGTGLGLAISQEDARLHGAWLHVWGRPGQGARFRLTIPRRLGETLISSPLALAPDDARLPDANPPIQARDVTIAVSKSLETDPPEIAPAAE